MRVEIPARTPDAHVGLHLELHTQLIVREDSLTLYGFATSDELEVFGLLLGVPGVGPRSSLGVLSELAPSQIAQAAASEDERPFRKVSGIGPKTAKLIVVQLAGKLQANSYGPEERAMSGAAASADEISTAAVVEQGLIGLGYSESDSVRAVADAVEAGAPVEQAGLLRAALALLQAPRAHGRPLSKSRIER